MFNEGQNFIEKQEILLKNIEDKTDNQLDLIRDQGDRQLDLIGKINVNKTKSTGFQNKRLKQTKKRSEKKIRIQMN